MATQDKCDQMRAMEPTSSSAAEPAPVQEVQEGPTREQRLYQAAKRVFVVQLPNGPQPDQVIVSGHSMQALGDVLEEYE